MDNVKLSAEDPIDRYYGWVNGEKWLGLGDTVHLASALAAGADTFVTNDKDLAKLHIPGLKIATLQSKRRP